jgi:hypothetical protein
MPDNARQCKRKKNTMHTRQTQLGLKDGFNLFGTQEQPTEFSNKKCPTGQSTL